MAEILLLTGYFIEINLGSSIKRNIGILLTCVDDSEFARRFPDDGEKFRRLLQPLLPDWTFTIIAVKDNVFPEHVSDYDGYIITGSPNPYMATSRGLRG